MKPIGISSRHIILFLLVGLLIALGLSLAVAKQLSMEVSAETRNRDMSLLFGAIEAGPLAIARLQSSAISQEQLNLLMSNPQLDNRGFIAATIYGGPKLSYQFAEWRSKENVAPDCRQDFQRTFEFPDAINPFLVTISRNNCQILAEQKKSLGIRPLLVFSS